MSTTASICQGPQFRGEVMCTLTQSLQIKQMFTSPYQPQTNGLTKHMNNATKWIISVYVDPLDQD